MTNTAWPLGRHVWTLKIPGGQRFRLVRWTELPPGKVFQESQGRAAIGVLHALRFDPANEEVARAIYADVAGLRHPSVEALDERAWGAVQRALQMGHYVVVADRAPDITFDQLMTIMPRAPGDRVRGYLAFLNAAMDDADITTPLRRAAFLAQLAHESGQLKAFREYATGEEYEGRTDLGNTQPGDGRRFKGRGPIQITGRANYRALGRAIGVNLLSSPELLEDPAYGFRGAAWFWTTRAENLNHLADARNFDRITYRVNGGFNGKASRDAFYTVAKRVLGCE